jgi:hypothetical protein
MVASSGQVEIFFGCFELQAHWEFFSSKCLDWRRSTYSSNIDLDVDALGSLLPDIIISSTFGSCAFNSCGYLRSSLGLNCKRLDFNLKTTSFSLLTYRLSSYIVFLLPRSASLFISSCRSRPPLSHAQDCASHYSLILPCLSALQCSINDTSHRISQLHSLTSSLCSN